MLRPVLHLATFLISSHGTYTPSGVFELVLELDLDHLGGGGLQYNN